LLDRFRLEVAGTSAVPWKVFASRLGVQNRWWETRRLRSALRKTSSRLDPGTQRYWTRRRLARLDKNIRQWRQRRELGALQYRA
jgi:hypothetical protein